MSQRSFSPFPRKGRKKAVLIGVRMVANVEGLKPLRQAHADVDALKDLLLNHYGYKEEDIIVMKDRKDHPPELWPKANLILQRIDWLVKDASENDQFFFYYSGHGNQTACSHGSEIDGKDEGIFGANGPSIIDNKLKKRLVDPLVRGSKLFALFDCCHSETILDLEHHNCNNVHKESVDQLEERPGPWHSIFDIAAKSVKYISSRGLGFVDTLRGLKNRKGLARLDMDTDINKHCSLVLSHSIPISRRPLARSEGELLRRVLSPMSMFCAGNCQMTEAKQQTQARVICLSACKDNQVAYDDNETGETMTSFFISALRNKPNLTLLELLTEIRGKLREVSQRQAEYALKTAVIQQPAANVIPPFSQRPTRRNALLDDAGIDKMVKKQKRKHSYQEPRFASHYRLNLNERVDI